MIATEQDMAPVSRTLWKAIEPIHMVVYFANEPAEDARRIGLKGFWMSYFAGRLAPLGPVPPETAGAITYVFAPRRVSRSIPDAWRLADPRSIIDSRIRTAAVSLRRHLPPDLEANLADLAEPLWNLVAACSYEGRALAAAWSSVPRPTDLLEAAWLAATILREHRGDGHVIALAAAGLNGIEAGLTHAATGAIAFDMLESSRGWTPDELARASTRLLTDGIIDREGGLTNMGRAMRSSIEQKTDELAAGPVNQLPDGLVRDLIELAAPISRHLIDSGLLPIPNPVGAPRP